MYAKPVQKKAPFTIEMLQAIVQDTKKNNSLANIRLATVCLLAFAGFLRYDELANIRCCDLQLSPSSVTTKIPKSKTDQLRQGNEVLIARIGSDTCPVAMLEQYPKRHDIAPVVSCFFSSHRWFQSGEASQCRMLDIHPAERTAKEQVG